MGPQPTARSNRDEFRSPVVPVIFSVQDSSIQGEPGQRFQLKFAVLDHLLVVTDYDLCGFRINQNPSGISDRAMKMKINEEGERDGQQSGERFHSRVYLARGQGWRKQLWCSRWATTPRALRVIPSREDVEDSSAAVLCRFGFRRHVA